MRTFLSFNLLLACAHAADHFITICSKVNGEDGSLVEFIEYHRIQGVTKFVFYAESTPHDRSASLSTSQLRLLAEFYQQRGLPDLISVEHTGSLLLSGLTINAELLRTSASLHRVGQTSAFRHCMAKYADATEWLIMMDADEFLAMSDEGPRETTVAEYFKEFGSLVYREGPSEKGYSINPTLSSPRAASFLRDIYQQGSADWVPYVKNGTLGGLVLTSAPFGSAGQFWDANNVLVRDPVSGLVNLYFDPRDNFVFNVTMLNFTQTIGLGSSAFMEQFKRAAEDVWANTLLLDDQAWDQAARRRLDEIFTDDAISVLTSNKTDDIADYFVRKLRHDYPAKPSHLPALPLWPIHELSQGAPESVLRPTLATFAEDLEHFAGLLATKDLGKNEKVLDDLHELYAALWSVAYPLRLERAVWRIPTFTLGDDLDEIRRTVVRLYPECTEWVEEAVRYMDSHPTLSGHGAPLPPELVDSLPHTMCAVGERGPDYSDFTQLGKTAYWVGEWRRREPETKSRMRSELEMSLFYNGSEVGCPHPWIHHCGFRQPDVRPMVIARTNSIYEVRINHQMPRSYFQRSIGFPTWRKNAILSYFNARGRKLLQYEKFANDILDTSIRKWLPRLRAAMRVLLPRPRLMQHDLLFIPGRAVVRHHGILSACDHGEVVFNARAMCPADFPSVAFAMPRHPPPPSPLIPGGWCTDKNLTQERSAVTMQGVLDVSLEGVHMCPGWPEVSCCDHTLRMEMVDSLLGPRRRPANVSAWLLPNVCVQCAPLEK